MAVGGTCAMPNRAKPCHEKLFSKIHFRKIPEYQSNQSNQSVEQPRNHHHHHPHVSSHFQRVARTDLFLPWYGVLQTTTERQGRFSSDSSSDYGKSNGRSQGLSKYLTMYRVRRQYCENATVCIPYKCIFVLQL